MAWPRLLAASVAAGIGLTAMPAAAHAPVPGIEGFYTGIIHPLSTAGQILLLLAIGIAAGQYPRPRASLALGTFVAAVLAGIIAGQIYGPQDSAETVAVFLAAFTSACAALAPRNLLAVVIFSSAAAGVTIGVISTPDPGELRATIFTVSGSLVGATLAAVYLGGALIWLHDQVTADWFRIGVRVIAAWVAAASALMAALAFAPT